ncbi:MAG: 2-cyclic phosphate phosphodiesterase [Candidatus Tokpelaia sp. JSC085]|nr:MAG: 2-cyclic phosphate phosphodiesterase [Candidatus Tokpelaia sp. JSC085]
MTARLRFTILGCGSSSGVPRANGDWGACNIAERKNRRYRSSLLIERMTMHGKTTVVIDTGPDFRNQMISAGICDLDAVLYTHCHADHTNGIDDLRPFVLSRSKLMDVYADEATLRHLYQRFGYCFKKTRKNLGYLPILQANKIDTANSFSVTGNGGTIVFQPHLQIHGNIHSLGFRIDNVAYCTDVSAFPDNEEITKKLDQLDVLIIEALQYNTHPSHCSLEQALHWIKVLAPQHAILTSMHILLDYCTVLNETPENVEPAYDGMHFECNPTE